MYLDAYNSNINSLNKIEKERNTAFHKVMANVYMLAQYEFQLLILIDFTDNVFSNGGPGNEQPPPTLTLDLSLLEDD